MKMKKVLAVLSALCMSMTAFSAMTFSASAADEVIGQAYFIGQLGGDSNWSLEDFASPADITGDGTYEVEWVLQNGGTDTVQFLAVAIAPSGTVDNFTTDSLPDLEVSLDEVWVDGVQLTDYTVSDAAIDTSYYDSSTGMTRIYLRDEWAGTGVSDLAGDTAVASSVKVTFTVSGTGVTEEGSGEGGDEGEEGSEDGDYVGGTYGDAYFIGQLGGDSNWALDTFASPTAINGDGTYELQWDLTAGGTDTVQFLAVAITPSSTVDNFTTDSLPALEISLDEVWVDGVQLSDYVVSDAAIDTAYYDSSTGMTRIYLRDEWAGTGVADLAGDTAVASSIKVVFTITGLEATETDGALGDVNTDGAVDATDAANILKAAAALGSNKPSGLTPAQEAAADVNGDGAFDATDAAMVLKYAAAVGSGYTGSLEDFLG